MSSQLVTGDGNYSNIVSIICLKIAGLYLIRKGPSLFIVRKDLVFLNFLSKMGIGKGQI